MEVKKEFERKKKSSESKAAICHLQCVRCSSQEKGAGKTHKSVSLHQKLYELYL